MTPAAESPATDPDAPVRAAWERLETSLLPRLAIAEPHWGEEPASAVRTADPADRALLTQQLHDLGFLPSSLPDDTEDDTLRRAVAAWRAACRQEGDHPTGDAVGPGRRADTPLTAAERTALAAQTGFEGGLLLTRLPTPGERSLAARVARFRLRVFDLLPAEGADAPPDGGFPAAGLAALRTGAALLKLRAAKGQAAELRLLNLLGDAAELSNALMKPWGRWVYVFRQPPEVPSDSPAHRLPSLRAAGAEFAKLAAAAPRRYERLFIAAGKHRPDLGARARPGRVRGLFGEDGFRYYAAQRPLKWIREAIAARPSADEAVRHPVNRLGLKALQVRLWALGYYRGALDGVWGPLSYAALRELLADHDLPVNKLVQPLAGGFVALNLRYLFKRLLPRIERQAARQNLARLPELEAALRRESRKPAGAQVLGAAAERLAAEEDLLYQAPHRRRYPGRRGVLAALGRFFRRAAGVLTRAVRAILRGLARLARGACELFRGLLRRVRRGLRLVGLAVKRFVWWWLGRPFLSGDPGSGRVVLTHYARDGDAFEFVSAGLAREVLRRHRRSLRRWNLAFSILARLALKAVDLLAAAAAQNWFRVAWDLARLVTSRFWRDLRRRWREYRALRPEAAPMTPTRLLLPA